jgi:hypothetical protein
LRLGKWTGASSILETATPGQITIAGIVVVQFGVLTQDGA